jgi:tripartite-type tricarboxylate transporter receptor subunit TctC
MYALPRLTAALAFAVSINPAIGQQYPAKPVRIVVAFSAGGGTDFMARLIGQKLTEWWGHQVVVENRPGAAGTIGADFVAKAPPDGYTLMLGSINQNALAPAVYSKLPYNAVKDFSAIAYVGYSPNVLIVHPSLPVRSPKELIALAKARPGELASGSSGNGSTQHIALEMFMAYTGTKIIHVPYKGSGQSTIDLVAGQVQMNFDVLPPNIEHIKQGRLRPLAVTTLKRSSRLPEIPTLDESGLKGFEMANWYGFYGPAGLSRELVARLNSDFNRALKDATVYKRLVEVGNEIAPGTPESFDAYTRAEIAKYEKLVKTVGVRID